MKLKKDDVIAISGFLLLLSIVMLWTIDVSITGISEQVKKETLDQCGVEYGELGIGMTNGFFSVSPILMYHICLYALVLIMFAFFLIILHVQKRS